jgi:hypothetical protein
MLSDTTILEMISGYAAWCGDPAPRSIEYVRGARGALNMAASGAGIGGSEAVTPAVLVQAAGHFERRTSGIAPPGVIPMATGTAISLIINEQTGQVTDSGIGPRPIDLSTLGAVVHLSLPQQDSR